MRRIKTAKILGRKWRFDWSPIDPEDKAVGLCYKTEHEIQIDPQQRGRGLLDTIIHETIHGADPAERKDLASGMFMRGGRSLRFYWPK